MTGRLVVAGNGSVVRGQSGALSAPDVSFGAHPGNHVGVVQFEGGPLGADAGQSPPPATACTPSMTASCCSPSRLRKMAEIANLQLDDAKKRLAMMIDLAAADTD